MKPINRYDIEWVRWTFRTFSGRKTAEKAAITLAPIGIFWSVKESETNEKWRKHEEYHWYHQQRWLFVFWYPIYWLLDMLYGYEKNPWEIQARKAAGQL